jgi:hypothetical protein
MYQLNYFGYRERSPIIRWYCMFKYINWFTLNSQILVSNILTACVMNSHPTAHTAISYILILQLRRLDEVYIQ